MRRRRQNVLEFYIFYAKVHVNSLFHLLRSMCTSVITSTFACSSLLISVNLLESYYHEVNDISRINLLFLFPKKEKLNLGIQRSLSNPKSFNYILECPEAFKQKAVPNFQKSAQCQALFIWFNWSPIYSSNKYRKPFHKYKSINSYQWKCVMQNSNVAFFSASNEYVLETINDKNGWKSKNKTKIWIN